MISFIVSAREQLSTTTSALFFISLAAPRRGRLFSGASYTDFHVADIIDVRMQHVAGMDWSHALRSSAQQDVARPQCVEGRGELDQLRNTENQVPRVSLLAEFTVDRDPKAEIRRVAYFVRGHNPGTQHRIGIDRFPQTAFLGPTDRNVQADAVARNKA